MENPRSKKAGAFMEMIVPGRFSIYLKSNTITVKAGK
jgi:hypothetical protein